MTSRKYFIFIAFVISILLSGAIWICCDKCPCEKEPNNNGNDTISLIQSVAGDTCLGWSRISSTLDSTLSIEAIACTIFVDWLAELNCCPESTWIAMSVVADTIILAAHEADALCDCNCPFAMSAKILVQESGTYYVRIPQYSGGYTFPERIDSIVVSGCP